jgi:hypothetical protein
METLRIQNSKLWMDLRWRRWICCPLDEGRHQSYCSTCAPQIESYSLPFHRWFWLSLRLLRIRFPKGQAHPPV